MISGTAIVKNRLQTIAKCINSFAFCDEVIIVDTGSTDGTLEYLKGLTNIKLFKNNKTKNKWQNLNQQEIRVQ